MSNLIIVYIFVVFCSYRIYDFGIVCKTEMKITTALVDVEVTRLLFGGVVEHKVACRSSASLQGVSGRGVGSGSRV